jgi:DNA-binding NarL/FixJ family response regulator
MPRVYVLDPIPVQREGYAAVLSRRAGFEIVGLSGDVTETERALDETEVDVVLVDARLSGVAWQHAIARVRRARPPARVLLVVAAIDPGLLSAARGAGVHGLLLRTSSPMQIRRAVRAVAAGETFFDVRRAAEPSPGRARDPFRLTAQQQRVLELIARGLSNKEIGIELHISDHTVKTHVTQLLRKLRARDRAHAAVIALREGIV